MNRLRITCCVLLLIISPHYVNSQGFFARFGAYVACAVFSNRIQKLGLDNTISCDCEPDFSNGVRAQISCEYDNSYCIIPEFCATPTFEGDYGFQGSSYTEICYDVAGQAQNFLKDLCFKGRHSVIRNLRFADCTASYGGDPCDCEVCSGGLTAKIDCSAVDGPAIPCASLGI